MYTQFTLTRNNITNLDVLIFNITQLPINGIEETEEAIIFYAEGENDAIICENYLNEGALVFTKVFLPPTNWNALWESNFPPVQVGGFLNIRADFHKSLIADYKYEITINPKMSFGTGHHATTQAVILLMQGLNFKNKMVLDFGTGTGILAIFASMLGALHIDACDNDNWCIENSLENIATNNIANINIFNASTPLLNKNYNVVIANVNRHILLNHGIALTNAVQPNGTLIISGILDTDVPELTNYFEAKGFRTIKAEIINNWAGINFIKQ